MKSYLLTTLASLIISSQIACDWRNCSLVVFAESAAVSGGICELLSLSAHGTSGSSQQFSDTLQDPTTQMLAMCALVAKLSFAERMPSLRDNIVFAGLLCGPLLKNTGCQLWQHLASNVSYFRSLSDIPSDSLLARHRSR